MSFTKSVSQQLGILKSFSTTDSTLCAETSYGKVGVKLYSHNIFRISATRDEKFEDFSYSVVLQPELQKMDVQDAGHAIIIQTQSCKLVIDKNPVKFSFQTLDGKIINED